ncbi:MAG TPA: hypothetical protein VG074_15075 [Acidimicrobiales bacterium]|jgi:hypothetical protein|nr:hypothetical protein [Acidimicrobiales bacterium]
MNEAPVPYYLKPKATKLAEGPDVSLDPPVAPTDAERRGIPPIFWAAMDKSKGGTAPQDAPLAPPATDSAKRTAPVLIWPRVLPEAVPNRPLKELVSPIPDLDPDIALWPVTILSRWPFAGSPSVGIWPKGWMGVDNTAAIWVCTVAGEPGTWRQIGAAGPAGGWPTNNGTGPGNLTAETPGGDTVGYNMTDQGSGGFTVLELGSGKITLQSDPGTGILLVDNGSGGVELKATAHGNILLDQEGSGAIRLTTSGTNIEFTQSGSGAEVVFTLSSGGQFILAALPTSDPSIPDALWNDNGVVVYSGSTTPLGDSGWVTMTPLLNGWGSGIARYRKLNGMVTIEMQGLDSSGASATGIFDMPAGFRPTVGGLGSIGTAAVVDNAAVLSAGVLTVNGTGTGLITCSNMDGSAPSTALQWATISFPADA